jgi:AcrR family transcriptional regulator
MKDSILMTAITILREKGIKKLSQPEICKTLNIRQSQLTYYFPRRADLIEAIVSQFTQQAEVRISSIDESKSHDAIIAELIHIITSERAIRGYLGLMTEADSDTEVKLIIENHMMAFEKMLKKKLQSFFSKEQIRFILIYLRGLGITHFLSGGITKPKEIKESIKLLTKKL